MSSSTSGQWIPMPRPIRLQLARWAAVARNKRGNHSNGAETRRPSTSVTMSSSSVQETSTASATGLLAKMLIPRQHKLFVMGFNQGVQFPELRTAEPTRFCEFNQGFEPEFGVAFRLLDMDVSGFLPLAAEEEKAKAANADNFWHLCRIVMAAAHIARLTYNRIVRPTRCTLGFLLLIR